MEAPEPAILFELRDANSPGELLVVSVTGPPNPLTGVMVIAEVPGVPALSVRLDGLAPMLKSTTLTIMIAVCRRGPLVPVIVTL